MAKIQTMDEMAKQLAENALDNFLCNGKSLREWMRIIASEDAISRQAVLEKAINVPIVRVVTEDKVICRKVVFADDIENLPPVTPTPKTGHWIKFKNFENGYDHIKCSECGQYWSVDGHAKIFKHCFNCGAKMEVE